MGCDVFGAGAKANELDAVRLGYPNKLGYRRGRPSAFVDVVSSSNETILHYRSAYAWYRDARYAERRNAAARQRAEGNGNGGLDAKWSRSRDLS